MEDRMTHFDRTLAPRPESRPAPGWRPVRDADAPPRAVSSEALLQGARRLTIAHGGEVYTLHLTRQNKLLLTK
jgi:hemin uptake protein HemP